MPRPSLPGSTIANFHHVRGHWAVAIQQLHRRACPKHVGVGIRETCRQLQEKIASSGPICRRKLKVVNDQMNCSHNLAFLEVESFVIQELDVYLREVVLDVVWHL